MADLIAIGYDDETTAARAAEEVERMAADLIIEPDAVAVVVRDREGEYGLGALMGKIEKTGIDREFQEQVRDMVEPGTSALFVVVEKVTPDKAVERLQPFGGTVLKSSLSKEGERELQESLHGQSVTA